MSDAPRIPDNAGREPEDEPIVPGGPAVYWSTLPIKGVVGRLGRAGIPAAVSNAAGTFVCNHVFYSLMHLLATGYPEVRGGFVYIPSCRNGSPTRRRQAWLSTTWFSPWSRL